MKENRKKKKIIAEYLLKKSEHFWAAQINIDKITFLK